MKLNKNKVYDPTSSRVICHYFYKMILDEKDQKKILPYSRVNPEVISWLNENIGEGYQPADSNNRSWALSSNISNGEDPCCYFTHEDDALLFKMAWE